MWMKSHNSHSASALGKVAERKIYLIRDHRVMLSFDLAELYSVEHKVLNQSVKRNLKRFPADFMFQLSDDEFQILKSQFVTSSWGGVRRANPYAFTEQGIAMLSSILNSEQAIQVNVEIIRAFVRLRQMISSHRDLAKKLEELERKYEGQFRAVFEAIRQIMNPPMGPKRKIGIKIG
ncbi:MAG: ORF6N domain-containing protein [bacterium]